MSGVDVNIVREYFELNGFLVRQLRKYQLQRRKKNSPTGEEIDLVAYNPNALAGSEVPFMPFANDLNRISRAIISVKPWHTHTFTPAKLKSADLYKFLEKDVLKKAEDFFNITDEAVGDTTPFTKILVLPGLPTQEPHRTQSMELLREHGVDAIISFRSMLQDILGKIEVNHNYEKSDLLQLMRILKNYDMIKHPQMELFGGKR